MSWSDGGNDSGEEVPSLLAWRCPDGHLSYPAHRRCLQCGATPSEPVDLTDRQGEVLTWTRSTATPTGVRQPNDIAIVEFTVEDASVRVLGQVDGEVAVGTTVRPVYVERLREPGIRWEASHSWDGYRFEPVQNE